MTCHVHHTHIFASDIEKTIGFYTDFFGGEVVADLELAGARNVFIRVGQGRIQLYDQPPLRPGRGSIHHIGIQTDEIEEIVRRLESAGVPLRKPITDFGVWKYVMVPAPDDILIELFQVDIEQLPPEIVEYFVQ
jgi:catechol 2,3-dioxygenase-like lactoylglutathione lyase family enzyme